MWQAFWLISVVFAGLCILCIGMFIVEDRKERKAHQEFHSKHFEDYNNDNK